MRYGFGHHLSNHRTMLLRIEHGVVKVVLNALVHQLLRSVQGSQVRQSMERKMWICQQSKTRAYCIRQILNNSHRLLVLCRSTSTADEEPQGITAVSQAEAGAPEGKDCFGETKSDEQRFRADPNHAHCEQPRKGETRTTANYHTARSF